MSRLWQREVNVAAEVAMDLPDRRTPLELYCV